GRRIRIESSAGTDVEIERDAMGEPIRMACNRFEARITRDLLGFPIELELPGDVRALWQRDSLGRPVRHDVRSHEQQARIRSYHWAPLFELTMVVDAMHGPVRYEHDVLSNLVAARYDDTVEQRICDAVGNLFKERDKSDRQYGPAGQLLDSAEARNTYDAEGNLVEKIDKTGQAWRYAWAADGTLSAVRRPDGNMVQFAYDAFGRRISKHCLGRTTHWTWDGNKPLHEWTDGASDDGLHGTAARPITWLFEPETYKPMAKLSDKTESIVTDHIGAPTLMLDAEGTRTWSADLSTYGEVRELEGDRFACPFRWPGQYEDAETGLYYNRARYYDPVAGQYTSQDPIRLHSREYNFYRYVSDPLEQYDPLGIDWNYHLTDSNGNTYYHGRASDNDTMAGVARRHAANEGTDGVRFGAGDTMTQITPSGTAYDAVRGIEQRGIAENALLGRNSGLARGNLINGMSEARQASPTGQARLRAADDILDGRRASEMPALNTLAARVC
ncbi:MAG TPA: RHS repeat-associated core domain-containing protein, partial [Polyangiales bacterium]|nr:RHS repeat-associated core domain-containing protein [Polyangiales bacterium]